MPITRQKIGRALSGFGAGVAGKGGLFLEQLSDERSQAVLEDAFSVQQHLLRNDVSGARTTLVNRLQAIEQLGGDPKDTDALLLKLERGDIKGVQNDVNTVVDFGVRTKRLTDPRDRDVNQQISAPKKVKGITASGKEINGSVVVQFNPETGQAEPTFLPDVGKVDPADPVVSTVNVGTLGGTFAEQADLLQQGRLELAEKNTQELKKRKVSALRVTREQTFIDEAISVGEELPEIKRAIALLASVKTGGFAAARIRAKQFFGIESADEGELASKLAVAVLARLRKTFGAQFTEGEGARLDRASARLGANSATNLRILETTLKRMEREVRRGLKFATNFEDQDAMDLINDALTFTYDQAPATGAAPAADGQESIDDILARNRGG